MDEDDVVPLLVDIDSPPSSGASKKIPITLITGFLGSGKTTFLKYVLSMEHNRRIAVIQNEFGEELGLERATTMGKPKLVDIEREVVPVQKWLELPNGCICCTAKGNLVLALENLVQQKKGFDYIFIETTGMADPGPLISSLWVDEELDSRIYLDAVLALVDAKHVLFHLGQKCDSQLENVEPRTIESCRQIALADIVLINKADLATEVELKEIEKKICTINRFAQLIRTVRGEVPLDRVLNLSAFRSVLPGSTLEDLRDTTDHSTSSHGDVQAISICAEGDVKNVGAVSRWLGELFWEKKFPIYRVKGEVSIEGKDERYLVQGVHNTFEVLPTSFSWNEPLPSSIASRPEHQMREKRVNRFVFIGQKLNKKTIETSFIVNCMQ